MPDKDFIHAREDVESVLRFADSLGLLMLPVELGREVEPRPRKPEELQSFSRGQVLLYRPDWVMDGIQVNRAERGVFAGTYSVRSGTNFSPVKLYFQGDEDIGGIRRLGDGLISFKREWLHDKAHEMRPAPPEVEHVYKQICKYMLSKIVVRGGVHRYHVCKQAAELAARMETLPPYDYIPWPPPNLAKKVRS